MISKLGKKKRRFKPLHLLSAPFSPQVKVCPSWCHKEQHLHNPGFWLYIKPHCFFPLQLRLMVHQSPSKHQLQLWDKSHHFSSARWLWRAKCIFPKNIEKFFRIINCVRPLLCELCDLLPGCCSSLSYCFCHSAFCYCLPRCFRSVSSATSGSHLKVNSTPPSPCSVMCVRI